MKRKERNPKELKRKRRHMHIRHVVVGVAERPRVCIFRSHLHIYAQIIDDDQGRTLAAVSSLKLPKPEPAKAEPADDKKAEGEKGKKRKSKKKSKPKTPEGTKILQAKEVGRLVAEVAKEKGITKIRFDRGGYLYHGRVAALAKAMREGGLEF